MICWKELSRRRGLATEMSLRMKQKCYLLIRRRLPPPASSLLRFQQKTAAAINLARSLAIHSVPLKKKHSSHKTPHASNSPSKRPHKNNDPLIPPPIISNFRPIRNSLPQMPTHPSPHPPPPSHPLPRPHPRHPPSRPPPPLRPL